jgi:hypothetical protein
MEPHLLLSIGSLCVAVVGLSVAYSLGKRRELGMSEWMGEFRAWGVDVISVLVRAKYRAASGRITEAECESYVITLSTLIERGRLYLPNQKTEEYGARNPEGYRGYRHPTLDILVAAIKILESDEYKDVRAAHLIELRRMFVSQILCILDPMAFNTKIAHLLGTSYRKMRPASTCGGLLPGEEIPSGDEALLKKMGQMKVSHG